MLLSHSLSKVRVDLSDVSQLLCYLSASRFSRAWTKRDEKTGAFHCPETQAVVDLKPLALAHRVSSVAFIRPSIALGAICSPTAANKYALTYLLSIYYRHTEGLETDPKENSFTILS